jgi:hypothetical protein
VDSSLGRELPTTNYQLFINLLSLLALFFAGLVAFLLASLLALLLASFLTLLLASFLAGLAFDSHLGLAAVLGAVVGASLAVGGFALLAAHALVGAAGGIHGAVVLAGFNSLTGGGVDGLFSFLVVAGNHSEYGHSSHCGKQNFLHCFDVLDWLIILIE